MDDLKEKDLQANFLFVFESVLMYFQKEAVKGVFLSVCRLVSSMSGAEAV
jgi:O-methyltransferase involved in polyketide biosynthesis